MNNNKGIELFFELLQVAMGRRHELSRSFSPDEWQTAFDLSNNHTVEGIALLGIEQLPPEQQPPKEMGLQWTFNCGYFASKNARLDKAAQRVVENFSRKGWRTCILKGQGLATYYPVPQRRHPGDIDVWVDAPPKEIIQYAHKYCPDASVGYHHVEFPIWEGISIELHYFPSFLYAPDNDRRLQDYFAKCKDKVMSHQVTLADGKSVAACPDAEFNAVYLLCHLFKHLMDELIVMRQYMDYYYVLRSIKDSDTRSRIAAVIEDIGLTDMARGMMQMMKDLFELEDEYLLVEPDEKIGAFLKEGLMKSDIVADLEHFFEPNAIIRFCNQFRHSMVTARYFPKESLWNPFAHISHWAKRMTYRNL